MVKEADVILRVQAESFAFASDTYVPQLKYHGRVRFRVLSVLKGSYRENGVDIDGYFDDRDDANDGPVPYDFIRRGGRSGNCFARNYRQGNDYLLFLRKVTTSRSRMMFGPNVPPSRQLTPYWAPLSPTNEQVIGADDPWVVWVRGELSSSGRN